MLTSERKSKSVKVYDPSTDQNLDIEGPFNVLGDPGKLAKKVLEGEQELVEVDGKDAPSQVIQALDPSQIDIPNGMRNPSEGKGSD